MSNNSPKRYRISVPLDDVSVIEWMSCQHSLSLSLRQLIKAAIEVNGMRDYFASDSGEVVQKPRRGRPPKRDDEADTDEVVNEAKISNNVPDRILAMQGLLNK